MSINSKSCRSDAVVRSRIAARLAEIQARAGKATDGPWERYGDGHYEVYCAREFEDGEQPDVTYGSERAVDAEFIAHARTDVPALTNAVESVLDYVGRCEESGITMQPGDVRRLIAAALGGAS